MKDPARLKSPRATGPAYGPGTYLCCSACGRLLKIEWATRSIVCSCGARVRPDGARTGK
jgi:hypothetical protein